MGYFIALIPSLLDSIAIYFDKFLLSKYKINSTIIAIYSGFFGLVTGLIVLLFTGFTQIDIKSIVVIISSGFFGVLYFFAYLKALTYDEGSRVGSLFQLVPVFVLFLSFLILGEKLHTRQYIGSILIVLAGFFLSLNKIGKGFIKINKAFWYMILASFFSALVYVFFKFGVKQLGFWDSLPYEGFGSGLATFCILMYGKNFQLLLKRENIFKKKTITYILIVEIVAKVSRYILFFALTLIPASIASVLMGFQPFFLLVIGIILSIKFPNLLKEVVTKKTVGLKLSAIICIFIGLYLIFL